MQVVYRVLTLHRHHQLLIERESVQKTSMHDEHRNIMDGKKILTCSMLDVC